MISTLLDVEAVENVDADQQGRGGEAKCAYGDWLVAGRVQADSRDTRFSKQGAEFTEVGWYSTRLHFVLFPV